MDDRPTTPEARPPSTGSGAHDATTERLTVVIADDHAIMREGLRMLLAAQPDVEVVAEADDLPAALAAVERLRPRVAVLDLNLRSGSSLEILPALRASCPGTAVVVLTMEDDPALAREALRSGASGYVLKEAAAQELVRALRAVVAGRTHVDPSLAAALVAAPRDDGDRDGLSAREVDVLRLIALGHTNREIAGELHLSVRTIDAHRAHIQQKLGRGSRAELVRYAIERKLLDV